MKIFLTAFAKAQIHVIYSYYKETASVKIADKIKLEIINAVSQLKDFPESGQVEMFMTRFGKQHRRLVSGNYKIIYRIAGDVVFVTDVYDSRQAPERMNP